MNQQKHKLHPKYVNQRRTRLGAIPEVRLWRAVLIQSLADMVDHDPKIRESAQAYINSSDVLGLMDRALVDRARVSQICRLVASGGGRKLRSKAFKLANGA